MSTPMLDNGREIDAPTCELSYNPMYPKNSTPVWEWASRVRYKPGWRIIVSNSPALTWTLSISFRAVDSRCRAAGMTPVLSNVATRTEVPEWITDREAFVWWLRGELVQLEMHELDEWLQDEKGQPYFDPHKEPTS